MKLDKNILLNEFNYVNGGKIDFWSYIKVEMFGIGKPGKLEPPGKENIQNFFMVPVKLEKLMFFGFFASLDSFLYVITYLPIRVVFGTFLFLQETQNLIIGNIFGFSFANLSKLITNIRDTSKNKILSYHRTHFYDMMRFTMFTIGCFVLKQINMGHLYHFIRGQNIIKLYVLTSMLEVMDKLLSSFGQDVFDTLHSQTRSNPWSTKLMLSFILASLYVCIHSFVYFLSVSTLTVVVNSADQALATVLILNNFTELKSYVLKKFEINHLFQLACSDITERFQLFLFLFLITVVALAQAGESMLESVPKFANIALFMYLGEVIADSMKHAFISKFNYIDASIYQIFNYVIRRDILSNQKDEIILDHTYSVSRRLGLSQIPLGCVFVRYIMLAYSSPYIQLYFREQSPYFFWGCLGLIFVILLCIKIILGIGLLKIAVLAHKEDNKILFGIQTLTGSESNTTDANLSEDKIESNLELVNQLSAIERYTVYKGKVI